MSYKFDFNVAADLVSKVDTSRKMLETMNEKIIADFKKLQEDFKDDGYQTYASEMATSGNAMKEVIVKLGEVEKALADYAELLKHV